MHRIAPCLATVTALALFNATAAAQDTPLRYDFSDAAQLADFKEAPTAGAQRYPHTAEPGVGIQPGRLDVRNRGDQGQTLHLTKQTFDLTQQPVTIAMKFQAGPGEGEPAATRVLLVFSKGPSENLVSGMGKVGMRVFRADVPKDAAKPWQFQLVNGISTRDIGDPFALTDGQWYETKGTFSASPDGKTLSFSLGFRGMGADGSTPGDLQRSSTGKTPASTHYDVRKAMLGILAQNAGGGAVAIDDVSAVPGAASANAPPPPLPPMEAVLFPPRPLDPAARAAPGSMFGAVGHVMHTASYYGEASGKGEAWSLPQTLPWLLDARLGWVREGMYQPWFANIERKDVERHRRDFEAALALYQQHGVRVVLCIMAVSPQDQWVKYNDPFFDYVADLVRRFDCVRVVEMHNEPNLKFFWRGTPQDYAATYEPAARRVKAARPDVQVAVGSVSSLWWGPGVQWLDDAFAAGVLQWADVVTVHPYNRDRPPEVDPHYADAPAEAPDHLEEAVEAWWSRVSAAAPAGKPLSLQFTELGYSSASEGIAGIGDETLQADYLSRLMLIYLDLRLRGIPLDAVHWYDLKDDGPREELGEHNFGLIEHDLSRAKPAFHTYTAIARAFADPRELSKVAAPVAFNNWPEAVKHLVWKRGDALVVPFWRLNQVQGEGRDVDFNSVLTLTPPTGFAVGSVTLHEAGPRPPRRIGFERSEGDVRVAVRVLRRAQWLEIQPASETP